MALKIVDEYGLTGIAMVDGVSRLLALGSIIARIKAGNDTTYDWYVEEWIRWASQSYSIRARNMADVSEQELLDHKLVNAGTTLAVSMSAVFSGVSISRDYIDHPLHQIVLEKHGLHVVLLNDIFSYDGEMSSADALQNFIEYQRLFHTPSRNVDDAIDNMIWRLNEFIREFLKAWKEMQTVDEDMRFPLGTYMATLRGRWKHRDTVDRSSLLKEFYWNKTSVRIRDSVRWLMVK